MPMLNDPDRQLVKDLEHQLEHQDPAWVRQFKDLKPSRRARGNLLPETAIGLLVLLAILCLLLGATVAAVIFRQRRHSCRVHPRPPIALPERTPRVGGSATRG